MSHAKRMLQQALQESLDRRDNGGPSGLRADDGWTDDGWTDGRDTFACQDGDERGDAAVEGSPAQEPPVEAWAARQLQRAVAL